MKLLLSFFFLANTSYSATINRVLTGTGVYQQVYALNEESIEAIIQRLDHAEKLETTGYLHTSYDLISYRLDAGRYINFGKLVLSKSTVFQIVDDKLREVGTSSCSFFRYGQPCEVTWATRNRSTDTKYEHRLRFVVGKESELELIFIRLKRNYRCKSGDCVKWFPAEAYRHSMGLEIVSPKE